jgi:hypothetical protein
LPESVRVRLRGLLARFAMIESVLQSLPF